MRSKFTVDLSVINSPIIRVDVLSNDEDLRDKVLKRFFEDLGSTSNWLYAKPDPSHAHIPGTGWTIRPIRKDDLSDAAYEIFDRLLQDDDHPEHMLSGLISHFAQRYASTKGEPISVVYTSGERKGTVTFVPDPSNS